MAASIFVRRFSLTDLTHQESARGVDYLREVAKLVSNSKSKKLKLQKPANGVFTFGGLEDTSYRAKPDVAEGWGRFYLPNEENMQVVGVMELPSCHCKEVVLMTCENKKVYGFDGEELHLVAPSLTWLLHDQKIEYPAEETYYYGEAFKEMTEEDWRAVKAGREGKRLEEEYKRMVKANKDSFLQKLKAAAH